MMKGKMANLKLELEKRDFSGKLFCSLAISTEVTGFTPDAVLCDPEWQHLRKAIQHQDFINLKYTALVKEQGLLHWVPCK